MGIKEICQTIISKFNDDRDPFPQLSKIPLICAAKKRPGLSAIKSTSNIVRDLNKLGIPTGQMPDGTPNLTVAFLYPAVKETQRFIKEDVNFQGGIIPFTAMSPQGPIVTPGDLGIVAS